MAKKQPEIHPHQLAADSAIGIGTIVLFLLNPYLVERFALILSCVKMGAESDDWYLKEDLSIQCFDTTHFLYIIFLGLPYLVVYGNTYIYIY